MKRLWNKRIIVSGIVAIALLIGALATTSHINKIRAREEFARIIEANKKANEEAKLKEKDTIKEAEEEEIEEEEEWRPNKNVIKWNDIIRGKELN